MQVRVEDVSDVKKILHIEIPAEEVARELDRSYGDLKKTAKVKGFRPGKAPRSVLERVYKKDVQADVLSKLIQGSFVEALKETDLKVLGEPRIEPSPLEEGKPYTYNAAVEVNPTIPDIDYKGLSIRKTVYRASDEEVDNQLELLKRNFARQEPLEEARPARKDDFVLIDYEGFRNGEPYAETQRTENYVLKLGSGTIDKSFDEQIEGMTPGESREITVRFPEDHFNKNLAGQEITFQVLLREIRQEILPELTDAFVKENMGTYETVEDLKQAIRQNLTQGYEKRAEQELNEQIFTALLDRTSFEVPPTLVDFELEGIIQEAENAFRYHNLSLEEMGHNKESLAEKYRGTADKQVRRFLILQKLIDQEGLTISDEELDQGIEDMARNYGQPAAEIKTYYRQNKDKVEHLKHALLEKKAIGLILSQSQVEEVEPESGAEPEASSAAEQE